MGPWQVHSHKYCLRVNIHSGTHGLLSQGHMSGFQNLFSKGWCNSKQCHYTLNICGRNYTNQYKHWQFLIRIFCLLYKPCCFWDKPEINPLSFSLKKRDIAILIWFSPKQFNIFDCIYWSIIVSYFLFSVNQLKCKHNLGFQIFFGGQLGSQALPNMVFSWYHF